MRAERLKEIVEKVQNETEYEFDSEEIQSVADHTRRKCELNGKGDDYFPILFENELKDYLVRKCLNGVHDTIRRFERCAVCVSDPLA